jgi:hypothetical protein
MVIPAPPRLLSPTHRWLAWRLPFRAGRQLLLGQQVRNVSRLLRKAVAQGAEPPRYPAVRLPRLPQQVRKTAEFRVRIRVREHGRKAGGGTGVGQPAARRTKLSVGA